MPLKSHPWLVKVFSAACSIGLITSCTNTPPAEPIVAIQPPPAAKPATATVTLVSPTATVLPTVTPTALPTSTPAPSPTPMPTLTPAPKDPMNPFTGLPITSQAASHIPLLIKVSNSPEVRPQTGLSLADVVLEHYSEGGLTRYTALFLTNTPEKVGSVRSCRLIDIELVVIFGAGEVCSGTSGGVRIWLKQSKSWEGSGGVVTKTVWMVSDLGVFECRQQAGCKLPMFRTPDKLPPHNLYANAQNALKELQTRGKDQPTTFDTWSFSTDAPAYGKPTRAITVPYTAGQVTWTYNTSSGEWLRAIGGRPHTEKLTSKQLGAANVIVVYANHVFAPIREDAGGSLSIQIQLWGEGPVSIYRDGQMVQGRWQRTGNALGLSFVDGSNRPIPLKPGATWIEFVPFNMTVKSTQ